MDSSILIGAASVIVAMAAAYFTYKQSMLSLKQYTLSYIDMENNDRDLQDAKEWLSDIRNCSDYIESFYSTTTFLQRKREEIKKELDLAPESQELEKTYRLLSEEFKESYFPSDEKFLNEYIKGLKHIQKIIQTRLVASEAIISGMIDEETYWLVRHVDFNKEYQKLKGFILKTYQRNDCKKSYSREALRMVIKKWQLNPPIGSGIFVCMRKDFWEIYKEELQCEIDN